MCVSSHNISDGKIHFSCVRLGLCDERTGKYLILAMDFRQGCDPLIFPECVGSFYLRERHYTHFQSSHIKSESKAMAASSSFGGSKI
jgi:hypothetical protein